LLFLSATWCRLAVAFVKLPKLFLSWRQSSYMKQVCKDWGSSEISCKSLGVTILLNYLITPRMVCKSAPWSPLLKRSRSFLHTETIIRKDTKKALSRSLTSFWGTSGQSFWYSYRPWLRVFWASVTTEAIRAIGLYTRLFLLISS
jgi:hypothetical protein